MNTGVRSSLPLASDSNIHYFSCVLYILLSYKYIYINYFLEHVTVNFSLT